MAVDWVEDLSDVTIQRTVGPGAFARGMTYARTGRVSELSVDRAGRLIFASVQGTARVPYRVVVTPGSGVARWSGDCSCPMAFDCKHVAAVMVASRDLHEATLSTLSP